MKGKLWFHLFLKPVLFKVDTIVTINNEDTRFFGKYHPNVKRFLIGVQQIRMFWMR